MEFEEARKELQLELDKGTSLAELRKKIMKGNMPTKVSNQLKTKKHFSIERIQRKKRDIVELLNKNVAQIVEEKDSQKTKAPTSLELWSKAIDEQDGGSLLNKKRYKMDDKDLMVRSFLFTEISFSIFLYFGYMIFCISIILLSLFEGAGNQTSW